MLSVISFDVEERRAGAIVDKPLSAADLGKEAASQGRVNELKLGHSRHVLGLAEGRHLQCASVALIIHAEKAQCPLGGLRSIRQRLSKNDVGASHHAAVVHLAFGGVPAALAGRNW